MARFAELIRAKKALAHDYFSAISGSAGRLVFSLLYFIALANTLSISDFGRFATASAAGVMLSRILGFGFTAPLYRMATVRPRLIGIFTAGFLFMSLLSLPVLVLGSWITFAIFFAGDMVWTSFALVVIAEALLWRPVETIIIVNNGLNRFGRGAILVIMGTLLRALAAVLFAAIAIGDLQVWVWFYLGANALSLIIALFFYPKCKLSLRLRHYWSRMADALFVAGSELLFYLQMEFDKLVVLALGGPHLAGIYAILMRLIDLTAIPIRTFLMMLVQRLMCMPDMMNRLKIRVAVESGIFFISVLGLGVLGGLLAIWPNILGKNVAGAASLVLWALSIPGFRNLTEYHSELLFARGQTLIRAVNLAILTLAKLALLSCLLSLVADEQGLVLWLNAGFALLYLLSAILTYTAMRWPAKKV